MALYLVTVLAFGLHAEGRRANQPSMLLDSNVEIVPKFSSAEFMLPKIVSGDSSMQSPGMSFLPTHDATPSLLLEESKASTARPRNDLTIQDAPNSFIGIVSALGSLWKTLGPKAVASEYAPQLPLVSSPFSRIVHQQVASLATFAWSSADVAVGGEGVLAEPATVEVMEVPTALMIESSSQLKPTRSTLAHDVRDVSSMFFMLVNVFASVMFFNRGVKYLSETELSRVPRASRSFVFHLCISVAAAAFGVCNAFNVHELPLTLSLPWLYCARCVATSLLFFAFTSSAGAGLVESWAVASMGFMAWIQLGAALGATKHGTDLDLRWGLCTSGMVCGALAVQMLSTMPGRYACQPRILQSMGLVSDLITFCGLLYLALWLMESSALINSACAALLNGFIDMLFIVGCGHLLLKRENLDGAHVPSEIEN